MADGQFNVDAECADSHDRDEHRYMGAPESELRDSDLLDTAPFYVI